MTLKRKQMLWYVNLGLFGDALFLSLTGLINWLILPRGSEGGGGFLISLRHFIRELHEWAGLFFIVLVAVHIYLHKEYVAIQLNRMLGRTPSE